ncbi:hypothetical protein CHS0354_032157 [Potamilus streckersoni]|uniref:Uncharacterized protein n=1 Tax=Potamilus streckersoni TaxID=2493646 RepID=A0AAE0TGR0_9BIVA|nr:hypothetical protein CHS0354_032157 [Potamilus streckersoni]
MTYLEMLDGVLCNEIIVRIGKEAIYFTMKVILLLGLFALAGGRWIPAYGPLESISEGELMKEDSQMKNMDNVQLQFNLRESEGDEPFGTDTPIPDSLEDQVEALQDSDAGMQKGFGKEGVERQELVADGQFMSIQSDDRENSRFMDVPADAQAEDVYRY